MQFVAALLADPTTLPAWIVLLFSAALYPLGMMFGCSACCGSCRYCTGAELCGEECLPDGWECCGGVAHPPPTADAGIRAFQGCCGGEWHDTRNDSDQGVCCGDVWHEGYPQPIGCDQHCCGGVWHAGEGGCCGDGCGEWNSGPGTCCNGTWHTDEGTCCNGIWHTGEGTCCNNVWHAADTDPGECAVCDAGGHVWVPDGSKKCEAVAAFCDCGCVAIPEADNCSDYCCDSAHGVYAKIGGGCRQRCCTGGGCSQVWPGDCTGTVFSGCCESSAACPVACCEESSAGDRSCTILGIDENCVGTPYYGEPLACGDDCLRGACCTGIEGDPADLGTVSCADAGEDCTDGVTQGECDAGGGVFLGGGSTCTGAGDINTCRSPFSEACCEHKTSTDAGLTFTQPFRKRSPPCKNLVSYTATGYTDSPILIHGVPFGVVGKRCPFTTSATLCGDFFHVEPVPCETNFKNLDIEVCWTCTLTDQQCHDAEDGNTWTSYETLNFSGCDDLAITLGRCHCRCETKLVYSGSAVSTNSTLTMAGSATIEADGGALTLTTPIVQAGDCDRTLTLAGSSTALNTLPTAVADPSGGGKTSLRKIGGGTWRLSGTSTYHGTTTIVAGTILVAADAQYNGNGVFGYSSNGFDDAGGFIEVAAGCTVLLTQGVSFARYLRAAGGATLGGANTSGNSYFTGQSSILAGGSMTLQAATGGTVDFAGYWNDETGTGTPTVAFAIGSAGNAGVVKFSNDLTTSGSVTVSYGELFLYGAVLTAGGGLTVSNSTLRVSGSDNLISSSTDITLNSSTLYAESSQSSGKIAVAGSTTINVSSGKTVEITNTLSGSGTLTKAGTGTLQLSGTNTYSGTTTVSAGSLVVQFSSGLATSATFTHTTLSVAFSADPSSGATYTLLPGPTAQTYGSVTLTGTSATATYNSATSVLTID